MPRRTDVTVREVYPNSVPALNGEIVVRIGETPNEDIVVRDTVVQPVASFFYDVFVYPLIVEDTLDAPAGQVFPLSGDVDLGVVYGPNGTDYTGTLEQPIPANVAVGVGFGSGGTEFTGTLSAGGGYSRSRVVNK